MLRKINDLRGFELYAADGDIGRVTEFYFDDLDWTVLYMVIDSGAWLPGRRVLISPAALGETDWIERKMNLMITRSEIENSPEIDLHQPITCEQEIAYFAYFGWAYLWSGELRSTEELIGNQVIAKEGGAVGRIEDLIVVDLWTIRYLILSSGNVGQGERKLLFSPRWIDACDWAESKLFTSQESSKIQSAPEYKLAGIIKREDEAELYDHYDAKPYWE